MKNYFVLFYNDVYMSLYLSKSIGCPTPKVNSNVNYGLRVVVMFQRGFINYNKCTSLVGDVDNRADHVHVWVGVFGISRNLSLNFLVNLKLLSKNSFQNL